MSATLICVWTVWVTHSHFEIAFPLWFGFFTLWYKSRWPPIQSDLGVNTQRGLKVIGWEKHSGNVLWLVANALSRGKQWLDEGAQHVTGADAVHLQLLHSVPSHHIGLLHTSVRPSVIGQVRIIKYDEKKRGEDAFGSNKWELNFI